MYCKRVIANKRKFDKRSFRWKKRGRVAVLVACPRGHWNQRTQRCAVGTRAQKILNKSNGSCPIGQRRVPSITSHR